MLNIWTNVFARFWCYRYYWYEPGERKVHITINLDQLSLQGQKSHPWQKIAFSFKRKEMPRWDSSHCEFTVHLHWKLLYTSQRVKVVKTHTELVYHTTVETVFLIFSDILYSWTEQQTFCRNHYNGSLLSVYHYRDLLGLIYYITRHLPQIPLPIPVFYDLGESKVIYYTLYTVTSKPGGRFFFNIEKESKKISISDG